MLDRIRNWPWLTFQIVAANVGIILALAAVWSWAFMQQSNAYSQRLMSTFNIEPGSLHAMYVEDVERQLWASASLGLFIAVLASFGLAFLIVRPLRSMAKATERLRHGDYGVRTTIGTGEVGRLAETFNALAAELEQEERRRAQYMADLSHELRTPITSLRGYIEGLEDGVFQADDRFFELIAGELSQLTALTHTIDSMQLDAGSRCQRQESLVDVVDFLEGTVGSWNARFQQRGLRLDLSISESVKGKRIAVPRNALKQIVDNLLSNMVRYAVADGPCQIKASMGKKAKYVELAFSNDTPDVSEAQVPFLFDRFYRVSKSRTRVDHEHPSGLGLSIVKQVCISNEGNVTASLKDQRLLILVELPLGKTGH